MPPFDLTHVLFVDAGANGQMQDGSLANPYKRIQTAVDVVNASVAEVVAEFPIGPGGVIDVPIPPTDADFPMRGGGARPIRAGGVRHYPIPPTVADSVQDWMILIAPGDYDEDIAISGPVRLALIGLGAFRLGRYTSQAKTQPKQANIVAEHGGTRDLVWTYTNAQAILNGAAPQLVIGTVGGTDVIRSGKPIANRISGSIIIQGGGWTKENIPNGGTAFLAVANTQVDAGITTHQAEPTQPAIDTTGSTFKRPLSLPGLAPFSGILVDRHFNSRFRGPILGRLNPGEGPPAFVLATSFMSQYEQTVKVSTYGSIQQATFAKGMTVSQAPKPFRLGVPPGMVSSTFAGEFKFDFEPQLLEPGASPPSPERSLMLDPITNAWFTRNGATLAGGATKDLLFETAL